MLLAGYYLILNVVAYGLFFIDKQKAIHHHYRIPNRVLIGIILLGGVVGAGLAMKQFHHKTQQPAYKVALAAATVIHGGNLVTWFNQ